MPVKSMTIFLYRYTLMYVCNLGVYTTYKISSLFYVKVSMYVYINLYV